MKAAAEAADTQDPYHRDAVHPLLASISCEGSGLAAARRSCPPAPLDKRRPIHCELSGQVETPFQGKKRYSRDGPWEPSDSRRLTKVAPRWELPLERYEGAASLASRRRRLIGFADAAAELATVRQTNDDSGGKGHQQVVVVDLYPLLSSSRSAKAVALVVLHLRATLPIRNLLPPSPLILLARWLLSLVFLTRLICWFPIGITGLRLCGQGSNDK